MKIAMTTFGGDGGKSGISRYIKGLLDGFAAFEEKIEVDVFLYKDEVETFLGSDPAFSIKCFSRRIQSPVVNIFWHQTALPFHLLGKGYDLAFFPAGNRRLPFYSPVPTIGAVHDFSCLHMEQKYDRFRTAYIEKVLPRLVRRLDRVITVSESSKQDIVDFAGVPADLVDVTPLGVNHEQYCPQSKEAIDAVLRRQGIKGPYLIYVSRIEHPGKNHVALIQAFNRLRTRLDSYLSLVLAGSDWNDSDVVHQEALKSPFADDIHFTGFAAEEDLPALYSGAQAMIFPSLYEGFGLPVLEAMACGTPVACSNLSSLPEVAGDAALLFDPKDPEQISKILEDLVTNEGLRKDLSVRGLARAKTYSWESTVRQTLASFKRVLECPQNTLAQANGRGGVR